MAAVCILPNHTISGALIELEMPDGSSKGKFLVSESKFYRAVSHTVSDTVCINNDVTNPNQLIALHPFDVNFIMLGLFEKCTQRTKFCALDQILEEFGHQNLLSYSGLRTAVAVICDVQTHCENEYFRLSEEKTLIWLKSKVEALTNEIKRTFPEFQGTEEAIPQKCYQIAILLMRDLLSEANFNMLIESFGLDKTDLKSILRPTEKKRDFDDDVEESKTGGKKKPKAQPSKPKIIEPPKNNTLISNFFSKK